MPELSNTVISAENAKNNNTTGSDNIDSSKHLYTYYFCSTYINKLINEAVASGKSEIIIKKEQINKLGDIKVLFDYLTNKQYLISFLSKENYKIYDAYDNTMSYHVENAATNTKASYCWELAGTSSKYLHIYKCTTNIGKDDDNYFNDDGRTRVENHWNIHYEIISGNNGAVNCNPVIGENGVIDQYYNEIFYIKISWNGMQNNPKTYSVTL